jgi:hypothetical protein
MFTARLCCGRVLVYEARSFLPATGEVVPCRDHGYCVVEVTGGGGGGRFGRAKPRPQSELLEWLRQRPVASIHALQQQRFSLRMLAAAEKDGLVVLDLVAGRVAARSVGHASAETPESEAPS